jgi:hypothetical protein
LASNDVFTSTNGKVAMNEKGLVDTSARTAPGSSLQRPDLERLSTPQLIARLAQDAQNLIKAEIELGKTELRTSVSSGLSALRRLAVGALLAFLAVNVLVAGAVLALAQVLPGWAAALVVGGVLAVASALAFVLARAIQRRLRLPRP